MVPAKGKLQMPFDKACVDVEHTAVAGIAIDLALSSARQLRAMQRHSASTATATTASDTPTNHHETAIRGPDNVYRLFTDIDRTIFISYSGYLKQSQLKFQVSQLNSSRPLFEMEFRKKTPHTLSA
jgi:hypothetical protein